MATFSLKIEGLSETINRLQRVNRAYAAGKIRPILFKGSQTFQAAVAREAPRRTGSLAGAIIGKLFNRAEDIGAFTTVDFSKLDSKTDARGRKYRYPFMIQHGVKAHLIRPRNGRVLKFGDRYVAKVNHPGHAANPFFTRGFRLSKNAVTAQIIGDLKALMALEVNR